MSTQPVTLNDNAWTLVLSGPTTQPVSTECAGMGSVYLACAADVPAFTAKGHLLSVGKIKMVELDAGENLYAYTLQSTGTPCELIITD